jgi:N-acetylneuraminic acid mutarotase
MPTSKLRHLFAATCGLALCLLPSTTHAHFLWLKTITHNDQPHAFLFFGENVADEAYHLPQSLANTKVWHRTPDGQRVELPVKPWDGEDRIGLGAPLPSEKPCVLEAHQQYGVYGTALLLYSAKHVHARSADDLNAAGASAKLKLDIVPRIEGERLELTVLWDGKPLAGAKVSGAVGDAEPVEKTTDAEGRVTFQPEGKGLIGVLASRTDDTLTGELGDKKYNQGLNYVSLTMPWPVDDSPAKPRAADVPALPEPVSSFGAAVANGWLYVYGGHIGTEHDHSAANLSQHFRRLRLSDGRNWQPLPMQTPLQGLALVAHRGKLYRVGGLEARNPTTDIEEDLHSTAEFAEFDPASGTWTSLTPLPTPRSSHNAVFIGDRLYVVGGWQLAGTSPGDWHSDLVAYDFSNPGTGWQTVGEAPFQRRALAVSHWNGKLVALGGMNSEGEVSRRVDMYDPESNEWTEGPELPGDGMAGFGISACNLDGELYVSGLRGVVLRLSRTGSDWEEAAQMKQARFFHQLLPTADGAALLAVGGASRKRHLTSIEFIRIANAQLGQRNEVFQ